MPKIVIPNEISSILTKELRFAGSREVGGLLIGEDMGNAMFRVSGVTVQRYGGTNCSFVRSMAHSQELERVLGKTSDDFTRHNYLGEWHSHPGCDLQPSEQDCDAMWDIVEDQEVGANFAVLLIVKLKLGCLVGAANLFLPGRRVIPAALVMEEYDYGNGEET